VYQVGSWPLTVIVSRQRGAEDENANNKAARDDRLTLSTTIEVRRRPTLTDVLGKVVVVAREPAFVNESVEFVYAVQRPRPALDYRLDFGDGLGWSSVSANSTSRLPAWATRASRFRIGKNFLLH